MPWTFYALDSFYRQPLTHILLSSNCLLFYTCALKLPILPSLQAPKSFLSHHVEDNYRNTIATTTTAKKDERVGVFPLFPMIKNTYVNVSYMIEKLSYTTSLMLQLCCYFNSIIIHMTKTYELMIIKFCYFSTTLPWVS